MEFEDLLCEAEYKYMHNAVFRGLVYTVVEMCVAQTGDEEIDHHVRENMTRATACAFIMSEKNGTDPEVLQMQYLSSHQRDRREDWVNFSPRTSLRLAGMRGHSAPRHR